MMPNFLVQTQDGALHCYWRADILRIDLLEKKDESVKVYVLVHGLRLTYVPTTEEAIRTLAQESETPGETI